MSLHIILLLTCFSIAVCAQEHPGIILTKKGVEKIKSSPLPPIFEKELAQSRIVVDRAIDAGVDVPVPVDMAGGYTHETHKRNYRNMHLAGSLYQITGEKKYAEYIRSMLLAYTELYPGLPIHPTQKSYATGKLFWQCLNDANWMVYTSQAYDAVYDYLSESDRRQIENNFLKPYTDFLSIENPRFFNRVHNHSTWANAAVGMMALVMGDEERLNRALYGLPIEETEELEKDNDGGFIYDKGKPKAGFFAQLDYAFSPDGYYTEGPYYQRYAMLPFLLFAQALQNKKPELQIFEYRGGLLVKAVNALLHQTNDAGEFFPINDAQKGMSIKAQSVVTAVNIAYGVKKDPLFLQAAKIQNSVLLDQNGFEVAKDLQRYRADDLTKSSIVLTDGKDGDEGAFIILRSGKPSRQLTAAFKCTSQGLGHGHYDKLSYALYDGTTELLQDYGAARWVNIDQKAGGRYLPENKTWAKQTIAHNTLVVDETSHFGGVYEVANVHHSDPLYTHFDNPKIQIASAKEINAYEDVEMYRILMFWSPEEFEKPLLIDIFSAFSSENHNYDMPYHHAAQILKSNVRFEVFNPEPLGQEHGYQHLYKEALAKKSEDYLQVDFLKDNKIYTLTNAMSDGDELILARGGANDPNFNIRRDQVLIHRKPAVGNATFLSVVESHGTYSPVTEVPAQPYSKMESVEILSDSKTEIEFRLRTKTNDEWTIHIDRESGKVNIK